MPEAPTWSEAGNWTPENIRAWVDHGWVEGQYVDFKSKRVWGSTKRNATLSKEVSAFANSQGGNIILGIEIDRSGRQRARATCVDGFDPTQVPREQIAQVANDVVSSPVPGLQVFPIDMGDHGCVYVVHIPATNIGAIQARDHKYYGRYDHESRPLEDWIVRAVNARASSPLLEVVLHQSGRLLPEGGYPLNVFVGENDVVELSIGVLNRSEAVAETVLFELELPERFVTQGENQGRWVATLVRRHLSIRGTAYDYRRYKQYYFGRFPIFRTWEPVDLSEIRLHFSPSPSTGTQSAFVLWTARGPGMTEKRGGYEVTKRDLEVDISLLSQEELPLPVHQAG